MSEVVSGSSAATIALSNVGILEQIITFVHIRQPCCLAFSLEEVYHTVSQTKDEQLCVGHRENLFSCILVSKLWASVAIPQLWGRYGELHHLLSVLHNISAGGLRYMDDVEMVVHSS